MKPSDMKALDIGSDDRVTMGSERGEMTGLTVFPFDVPGGNMLAYYPEANVLTSNNADPRSNTPSFKSIPVAVLKEG